MRLGRGLGFALIAAMALQTLSLAAGATPAGTLLSQTPCAAPQAATPDAFILEPPAVGSTHATAQVPAVPSPCGMGGQAVLALHALDASPHDAASDPAAAVEKALADPPVAFTTEQNALVTVRASEGVVGVDATLPEGAAAAAEADVPGAVGGAAGGSPLGVDDVQASPPILAGMSAQGSAFTPPMSPMEESGQASQSIASARESVTPGSAAGFVAVGAIMLLGFGLYSRLSRGKELDHPLRAAICDEVRDSGPLSAAELARRRGVHLTTALYHLRRLEAAGLLVARDAARGALWAMPGQAPTAAEARPTGLRERLLGEVCNGRGVTAAALAQAHGAHLTTILYHLRRLAAEGAIEAHPARTGTFWTAPGAQPNVGALEATRVDVARRVVAAVAQRPGASVPELARNVGVRSDHVRYHLQRLARSGVVRAAEGGRQWYPASGPAATAMGAASQASPA